MASQIVVGQGATEGASDFIRVREVATRYNDGPLVLDDVSMNVRRGEFVCIVGPSGCGKSSLLQVLDGLLEPQHGSVEIGGVAITSSHRKRNGDRIPVGYVFQEHRLLPWRTVEQNLQIVLAAADIPPAEWSTRIDKYLGMLEIGSFRKAWPLKLSGGQRQRASIARALAVEPAVILMDEPFSTLDEVTARALRQRLVELWSATEQTIVFVTHSIREAVYLADRVFVLSRGPAKVLKTVDVRVERPRRYEDPALTELEASIVDDVLKFWEL